MQRFNLNSFWGRYGKEKFEDTAFFKAMSRLPSLSPNGPWVAGGSVRRLVMDLPQESDFDFFFASPDQFSTFEKALKEKGGIKEYENEFNITYRIPAEDKLPQLKIQLIRISYQSSIENVLNEFDFSLCKCGYDGVDLFFGDYTLFDLGRRHLIPEKISFGVSSLRRMIKYIKQGYTICSGGMAEFLTQIANDPKKINADIKYID